MEKTVSWIVVADGGQANIFANEGPGKGLKKVAGEQHDAGLPHASRDIVSDRPGRTFDRIGEGRHGKEPPSDPLRVEKDAFLARIARHLAKRAQEGRFDRLILVAEPRALGALRQHLPAAVASRVHAELSKDLTKAPQDALTEQIGKVLAV